MLKHPILKDEASTLNVDAQTPNFTPVTLTPNPKFADLLHVAAAEFLNPASCKKVQLLLLFCARHALLENFQ